jgi:hypothetical protein
MRGPDRIQLQPSLRDSMQRALPFPAMNCWAILTHPSGMFPDYTEVFVRVAA